jgi:hypothetical protein
MNKTNKYSKDKFSFGGQYFIQCIFFIRIICIKEKFLSISISFGKKKIIII